MWYAPLWCIPRTQVECVALAASIKKMQAKGTFQRNISRKKHRALRVLQKCYSGLSENGVPPIPKAYQDVAYYLLTKLWYTPPGPVTSCLGNFKDTCKSWPDHIRLQALVQYTTSRNWWWWWWWWWWWLLLLLLLFLLLLFQDISKQLKKQWQTHMQTSFNQKNTRNKLNKWMVMMTQHNNNNNNNNNNNINNNHSQKGCEPAPLRAPENWKSLPRSCPGASFKGGKNLQKTVFFSPTNGKYVANMWLINC